jgi:hypothetical protein
MKVFKTFCYESPRSSKICYDIHENGLIYRPDYAEELNLSWRDIQYLEDCPGNRVDIFSKKLAEVPVRYETDEFSILLKTICSKLSEIRIESFCSQEFNLTSKYSLHLNFVISVLVLSLLGSLWVGYALFFMLLVLFVPIGIFILRQPFSLALDSHSLTVRNLLRERAINYSEIENIDFEVKSNDYGSTLCVLIELKSKRKMTIKKFENIILFFIMLQIKLNECEMGNKT